MMQPQSFDMFDQRSLRERLGTALSCAVALLLLGALAWFIYDQLHAVHGLRVEAPSPQVVSMLPPPPPPPPEPRQKPPEPREQAQPSPSEAPKTPQQQPAAAPTTMNADAQAGGTIAQGSGQGIGSPSSQGTCLGTNCGSGGDSGGMSEGVYRRYLSSELQERVSGDDRVNRLAFLADFEITVARDGRVTGVYFAGARGRNDSETMKKLTGIIAAARLEPPPTAMQFPYRISVRGRRNF